MDSEEKLDIFALSASWISPKYRKHLRFYLYSKQYNEIGVTTQPKQNITAEAFVGNVGISHPSLALLYVKDQVTEDMIACNIRGAIQVGAFYTDQLLAYQQAIGQYLAVVYQLMDCVLSNLARVTECGSEDELQ
ncbi:hypothetical protein CAPTEDRAFT_191154 [Capitella teleta]|uniref:Uncharacterized protein n=1 Tax=Capitella teleta TaxID=283909 RepID=R7UK46_CAPTE|nr:hypothetical protein CAPTEDRAFT_191154 [Capitella teleta]|eukprot:ELU06468.1 hypothetical protein CAPTEDRAFT_191154 [Capitella teleta]